MRLTIRRLGSGRPLLSLHGNHGLYERPHLIDRVAETREALEPDHPGFGETVEPGWMDAISDLAYRSHLPHVEQLQATLEPVRALLVT